MCSRKDPSLVLVSVSLLVVVVLILSPVRSEGEGGSGGLSPFGPSAGSPRLLLTLKAIGSVLLGPILLPLLLLLLLIPVPVLNIPPGRKRSLAQGLTQAAKDLLRKESCVERVVCELSRAATSLRFLSPNFIEKFTEKESKTQKWMEILLGAAEKDECGQKFICDPMRSLNNAFME